MASFYPLKVKWDNIVAAENKRAMQALLREDGIKQAKLEEGVRCINEEADNQIIKSLELARYLNVLERRNKRRNGKRRVVSLSNKTTRWQ